MLSLLRLTTMACLEIKLQESGSYSDSEPNECQRAVEAAAQFRHVDFLPFWRRCVLRYTGSRHLCSCKELERHRGGM
jgi:hypothetical protein